MTEDKKPFPVRELLTHRAAERVTQEIGILFGEPLPERLRMTYEGKKPRRGIVLMVPPAAYIHTVSAALLLLSVWSVFWFFYPKTSAWFKNWFEPASGWRGVDSIYSGFAVFICFAALSGASAWIWAAWYKHCYGK